MGVGFRDDLFLTFDRAPYGLDQLQLSTLKIDFIAHPSKLWKCRGSLLGDIHACLKPNWLGRGAPCLHAVGAEIRDTRNYRISDTC